LRVFIGTWTVEGKFVGGEEEQHVRGTATFRWLVKDALAVWRTRMAPAPPSTAVLGADDNLNSFTMLYSDERGVVRRFEMTLTARRWTMLRRDPGFWQRLTGHIAPNGRSIRTKWETSADGRRWMPDFILTYTKR